MMMRRRAPVSGTTTGVWVFFFVADPHIVPVLVRNRLVPEERVYEFPEECLRGVPNPVFSAVCTGAWGILAGS
jgi:hypothetical protein